MTDIFHVLKAKTSNPTTAPTRIGQHWINTTTKETFFSVGTTDVTDWVAVKNDVLFFANLAAFPLTGKVGVIYLAEDTGSLYKWNGASYVTISQGVTDHTLLSNIGTRTHAQLESDIAGKENTGVAASLVSAHESAINPHPQYTNNISNTNATDLTDGGDSTLHYHATDRDRANHTGTQTASTISDFATSAQSAAVSDSLADGVLNIAPSQNAVFDALATKQNTITGAATTIASSNLTASRALASDTNGKVSVATTTLDELNQLSGIGGNVQTLLNAKEPTITAGTSLQYWRGDKTWQTLNTSVVPEGTNLYWTASRFDTAFSGKTTSNLTEGTNLYYTDARARSASVADTITDGVINIAPSQNAVFDALALKASITYVDTVVTSVYKFISDYNAITNTPNITTAPNSIKSGNLYVVSVAGTFFGVSVEIGDQIIAKQDNPSLVSHWSIVQANLTAASIKIQYESNADTNAFTDAEQSKLAGIEAGAEVNNISDIDAADLLGTNDTTLHYHDSDRNRANHTGSQAISTVTGLQTALDGKLGTGLASANILVGNASNLATPQTMSGDVSINNTGVTTIANGAVTNVKLGTGIDAAKLGDGTVSNTEFQSLNGVNENIQDQFNRIDTTGISYGGEVTIASATTFNVAAGYGHIVDHSTNPPTKTLVQWNAQNNIAATLIASGQFTRIEVDSLGVISQTNTIQSDSDRLNKIQIGILVHDNLTSITNVFSAPNPDYNIVGNLRDLAESIGTIIISGTAYSANGANLNINRSQGSAFVWGRAYGTNKNFPSKIPVTSATALQFYRVHQSGANTFTYSALTNAIDSNQYNTGNALVAVPSNKWQIQYIYFYPEHGNTYIVYGQNVYNSKAEAISEIGRESTVHDIRFARAALRSFLVVKHNATSLNDLNQAQFLSGGKFGSVSPTGSAISSVTDLQTAYNASPNPEIELDPAKTSPALTIRDNSTPVSGNLIEVQNNAGSTTYFAVSTSGVAIGAIPNAESTINAKLGESFETVNKNLKQYPYTLNYTSGVLTSIVYTVGANTITKTLNYTSGLVTSIVLSGTGLPTLAEKTKNLTYTSGVLTSISYAA